VVTSILHVAVYCRDVEKSADFYTRVLGMKHLFTQKKDDGSLWYVYLYAGGGTFLELFPLDGGGEGPDEAAPGITHICLGVDDIEEAVRKVKGEGWPLDAEPRLGRDGNRQAWIRDPDGVRIELRAPEKTPRARDAANRAAGQGAPTWATREGRRGGATPPCGARRGVPSGCGGAAPAAVLLLVAISCDMPPRRALHQGPPRSQRGSRGVFSGALMQMMPNCIQYKALAEHGLE